MSLLGVDNNFNTAAGVGVKLANLLNQINIKKIELTDYLAVQTHLRRQGIIYKNVWSCCVWSEGPDRPGSQQIPVIFCLKKLSQLLPATRKQNSPWLKGGLHIVSAGTLRRLVDVGQRG